MKRNFTIIIISAFSACTFGQSPEHESVRKAVLDYVECFYEGDSAKLMRGISPALFKFGHWKDDKTNKYTGEPMSYRKAVDYSKSVLANKRFAKPDAPKKIVILDVEEQVAAAKLTAWWGIDYLLLAKHNNAWVTEQVLWQGL